MKRILSIVLALSMLLCAGVSFADAATVDYSEPTAISAEPITATFFLTNDTSYTGDEIVWQTIKELTNIEFQVIPVPLSSYSEKLSTTIASGNIPDIMGCRSYKTVDEYGPEGAFLSFEPYIEAGMMPNYVSVLDSMPPAMQLATSPDDVRYGAPRIYLTPRMDEALLARVDVLEKLGLTREPATLEEFYDIMLAVKEAYPDSTPWLNRWETASLLYDWGQIYNTSYTYYLAPGATEYVYGPATQNYKDMLQYLANMYKDGLLNKDFATMSDEEYKEAWITNRGFFAYDYQVADEFYDDSVALLDEGFDIGAMIAPPYDGVFIGYPVLEGYYGYTKAVSSMTQHPDEMIRFIDWTYSEAGQNALMFGIEGKDYTFNDDGTVNMITDIKCAAKPAGTIEVHGLNDQNIFSVLPASAAEFYENTTKFTINEKAYITEHDAWQDPIFYARFYNADENDRYNEIKTPLDTYITEESTKIIIGEKSVDGWDDIIAAAASTYNYEEGLQLVNKAYVDTFGTTEG